MRNPYRQPKKLNLDIWTFFYKGSEVSIEGPGVAEKLEKHFQEMYKKFYKEHHLYWQEYIDQLEIMHHNIDKGYGVTDEEKMIFMGNVYFLVEMGKLVEDDLNGMLYMKTI